MIQNNSANLSYLIPAFILMLFVGGILGAVSSHILNPLIDSHNEQVADGSITETSHYHFDKSVSVFKFFTTIGLVGGLVVWLYIRSHVDNGDDF
jgi:hypothetical protein